MSALTLTRTADVGIGALEDMIGRLQPEHYEAGHVLLHQGDVSEVAFFVAEGEVAVFSESEYERVRLATLSSPRLVGELGVLAGYPRTATIEALTPITVYRLAGTQLMEVGTRAPEFLLSVIAQLGRQLDGMNRAIGLYGAALSALEHRSYDARLLDDLVHPSPLLVSFAATFRRFAGQITEKRRKDDELASAALIQRSFLPRPEVLAPIRHRLDLHAMMRPALDVGGDFYDFFMIDRDRVAIAIGDVCGKGIPASLFMSVVLTTLRSAAREGPDVATTLARTNASLCRDNDASMFATLFYGVLDVRSGELEYGNCGHNAPYILSRQGTIALPATGVPVGLFDDHPAAARRIGLRADETLLLFTDGVTEAMNPERLEFGKARLESLLREAVATAPEELVRLLLGAVDDFAAGEDQSDDITCLALRRLQVD